MNAAYEHNGRPISREGFYAIACDPARSVAVEACAGAGKTWMLVSRMLRALLDGAAPHEILAITFTKKAAGEMRQRLQEWLEDFARRPLAELERELIARGIEPNAAREKREQLQKLYRQTLDAGRPVQIRTFHSWFAALLSTAPLAVLEQQGLPAHYELLEDDAEAVREVWRPFLHTVAQAPALRAAYEACVARHGRAQTHKALESALAKRVEFTLADEAGVVEASVDPAALLFPDLAGEGGADDPVLVLLQRERDALLAAALALGQASARTYSEKGVELETAVTQADADGVLAALFTQKGEPRKFSDKLSGIERVRQAQALCERAMAARRQHEAWQHQQRMALLARALIAQFAQLKRERGWVDMNDVERTALVMLSDPVLSGWVQERLDTRVRHLLVDEFQDTNPLQWQALHAWLSGYAGAGGGQQAPSVFIVGDPKQSIYRFRRAEPQVFLAAQAFVREGLGGDLLACDHTHRNATGVIAAVNQAMLAAQAQGEYAGFRAHTTESTDPGRLLSLPPIAADDPAPTADTTPAWRDSLTQPRHEAEETLRMRECAQAAQWVAAQIGAGVPPREIMVLARKRDRLSALQDALRALHIPCVQPEKAELGEAPEVRDVVALLDALVSPGHNLSLARALKSPLFGVEDDALVQLALLRREDERASWFDLLQKSERLPPTLQALGPVLAQYQHWVQTLPPHDALQAIYRDRDVLARYAAAAPAPQRAGVLANLRALLAAALQQGGGRYLTPYAFVRAMKRPGAHAPGRAEAQAVRLLTIHGAKGLEAHSVLLLDTDARPQKAETMGALVDWPGQAPVPRCFVFLASESNPPPSAEQVLAAELAERQREELNTLYVAMTRAKHCLALSCVQATNSAPGSWWSRLAPAMPPESAPQQGSALVDEAAAPELAELPHYDPPAPEEAARGPAQVRRAALAAGEEDISTPESRLGEAMHQLLEQAGVAGAPLATLRAQGWPERRLVQLARDFDITPEAARRAAMLAQRVLQGEGAWAWDPAEVERAFNEAPLVHQGQRLRLDRLVRRRGSAAQPAAWWVLDYKSAARPEHRASLQAQLRQYRAAVRAMMSGEPVFAAFLTGDGRMVVVDDAVQAELF